jgi:hypothetical protein
MRDDVNYRHDFKNQLGIILGFSEILAAEATAEGRSVRDLDQIRTAAVTALGLLDDMSGTGAPETAAATTPDASPATSSVTTPGNHAAGADSTHAGRR